MFDTKTPSAVEIIEDGRMKARLAELGRRQRETVEGLKNQHQTDAQIQAERFQHESNEYATQNALYAASRAASANFLVVPLDGTTPLVKPTDATNNPWQLFNWWDKWPSANPGVALGRVGGILALKVDDLAAHLRLREMARVVHPAVEGSSKEDGASGYVEFREIGGYTVRLVVPGRPFSTRMVQGWGKDWTDAVNTMLKEDEQRQPETFFLVWSYPSIVSGQDCFDYPSRKVGQGLTALAEGAIPWQGSILDDGIQVVAPMSKPPEIPLWLAKSLISLREARSGLKMGLVAR